MTELTNANVVAFIVSDPRSVGFSAIRTAHPSEDGPLIEAANNTSGPGAGTVSGDAITSSALLDLIDAGEFVTLTTAQLAQLQTIMSAGVVNVGAVSTQDKLATLLADKATSLANVSARFTRPAGPWEVYFGKGNQAGVGVLDDARNSNGGSQF